MHKPFLWMKTPMDIPVAVIEWMVLYLYLVSKRKNCTLGSHRVPTLNTIAYVEIFSRCLTFATKIAVRWALPILLSFPYD